jgi:hypothetical protein
MTKLSQSQSGSQGENKHQSGHILRRVAEARDRKSSLIAVRLTSTESDEVDGASQGI